MKDLIQKINAEYATFKTESESLTEKGVKAAGARARKATLELEKLLKEFRKVSVEESKNKFNL
ncbi:histone H1 [Flavobacterium frigoris]|uniref:Histone H1-like protein Hc1 n=1 Tax=Flavobacterium frigoris TaxID=229204 RepID=A0A1H9H7K2_FLAFI|nr:histone H1 [Flavobacterium frigoris]SEQ58329.1 Histone H1-like protein Hc1 [Flavobacterium frigoris]